MQAHLMIADSVWSRVEPVFKTAIPDRHDFQRSAVPQPRRHSVGAVDLVVQDGSGLRGFEIKRTAAPKPSRSLHSAMAALGLRSLDVIHAGENRLPLARKVRTLAAAGCWTLSE